MNEHLRDISLDISTWTPFKVADPFLVLGVPMKGLRQTCYQTELGGEIISAGVFEYNGKKTHIAWGVKAEPHCSHHALALPDGSWSATIDGCPDVKLVWEGAAVSGFSVDGKVFTAITHQTHSFIQAAKNKLRKFAPLIFFFTLAVLWATLKLYLSPGVPTAQHAMTMYVNTSIDVRATHEWMLDFMGGFFLIFGMLKAVRLKKFATTFGSYDVLARYFKPWGYVYPFVEIGIGVLYTARIFLPLAYVLTILVMSVGCVGIYLKLHRKEDVVCACLGGFFDIPLTGVTFFENFLMANMALVMLML